VKSGYGLLPADEVRILEPARRAAAGAGAVHPEALRPRRARGYRDRRDALIDELCESTLPLIKTSSRPRWTCSATTWRSASTSAAGCSRARGMGFDVKVRRAAVAFGWRGSPPSSVRARSTTRAPTRPTGKRRPRRHRGRVAARGRATLGQSCPMPRRSGSGARFAIATDFNPASPAQSLLECAARGSAVLVPRRRDPARDHPERRRRSARSRTWGHLNPGAWGDAVAWNASRSRSRHLDARGAAARSCAAPISPRPRSSGEYGRERHRRKRSQLSEGRRREVVDAIVGSFADANPRRGVPRRRDGRRPQPIVVAAAGEPDAVIGRRCARRARRWSTST
jgi:hypothetical protein